METTPPEQAGGAVQGYSRADVDQYLADAAAERGRLEAAIVAARERQRGAQAALAGSVDTTNIVHTALLEVQRELATRRFEVDREAEAIVAAARDEAASILRAARAHAHTLLQGTQQSAAPTGNGAQDPGVEPPDAPPVASAPIPPPAPPARSEFESALATITENDAPPESPAAPDIDLTLEDSFWHVPAAAAVTGNGGANGEVAANGSAHHGATNGQAVDAADTRGANGFATLLRRALPNRPPEAASTDEDDAFFDFLRGALEDHEPLGPRGDEGGQTSS